MDFQRPKWLEKMDSVPQEMLSLISERNESLLPSNKAFGEFKELLQKVSHLKPMLYQSKTIRLNSLETRSCPQTTTSY